MLKIISADINNVSLNTSKMNEILINSRSIQLAYTKEDTDIKSIVYISIDGFQ